MSSNSAQKLPTPTVSEDTKLRAVPYDQQSPPNTQIPKCFWRELWDLYLIRSGERVLELGGGTGEFWIHNRDRLPKNFRLTFTDISLGMLHCAQHKLREPGVTFEAQDAIGLTYPDRSFDRVVSHFMLYYVIDPERALQEIGRVLRSDGECNIALPVLHPVCTPRYLRLLFDLAPKVEEDYEKTFRIRFGAGECLQILERYFRHVESIDRPSQLKFGSPDEIIDLVTSLPFVQNLKADRKKLIEEYRRQLELEFDKTITWTEEQVNAILICREPRREYTT